MTARMHTRTIVLALLAACAGLGLYAATARAEFETSFDVTVEGSSGAPRVERAPTGAMHFLWWRAGAGIQTRKRTPDGALGPIHTLAPSGDHYDLAIDGEGNIHFTWQMNGSAVYARRLDEDGTLGEAFALAPGGQPRVAAGPTGAVFAWTRQTAGGQVVEAQRVALDGTLGPVKVVSVPGTILEPQVDLDDAGNAVLVWARGVGTEAVMETRRWKAGGELGPIAEVAAASTYVSAPQVAFDSTGTALYALARTDGLKLRRMAPDGVLSAVQDLRLRLGDLASDPRIAVSADGAAQIVWAVHSAEDGTVIETRHRFPNGLLSEVRILGSYEHGLTPYPDVAFDDQGNAHHVWLTTKDGKSIVVGRSRATSGALGPLGRLSADQEQAVHPSLSTGGVGRPIATWTRVVNDSTKLVQGALSAPPVVGGGGGSGSGSSGETPPDLVSPSLSGLSMVPGRLRFRRSGRVNYVLSENARLILRIARRGADRRVGGRCVKATRRNRSRKRCDLFVNARLVASGQPGRNGLRFSGSLRGRYLRPGRYLLVGVASDWAGNRSAPARAAFRVIKQRR
jgi:hypothetical protein